MTRAAELLLAVGWVGFWIYWFIAARTNTRGQISWSRELRVRAVIAVIVIALIRFGALRGWAIDIDVLRGAAGLVLFATGLAFAIWARRSLGRNWGAPMTRKLDPELVVSGAYRLVRHPIYSGILIAGVGTAVALGWRWLIVAGLAATYFIYSAAVEERHLTARFGDTYRAYQRSTKMMIPFIL